MAANKYDANSISILEGLEAVNMCKAWDDHKKLGIQEGIQQGLQRADAISGYWNKR